MWTDTLYKEVSDTIILDLKQSIQNFNNYEKTNSAIKEVNVLSFKVIPNPSNGNLEVKWDNWPCSKSEIALYDQSGREIRSSSITRSSGTQNWSNLSKGVYWIEATCENLREVVKVIVYE